VGKITCRWQFATLKMISECCAGIEPSGVIAEWKASNVWHIWDIVKLSQLQASIFTFLRLQQRHGMVHFAEFWFFLLYKESILSNNILITCIGKVGDTVVVNMWLGHFLCKAPLSERYHLVINTIFVIKYVTLTHFALSTFLKCS
jgi:hypothetical protein